MKTLANRLVMFAASAVVLGTMAYGQTNLKAEVPFAFRTASATLPAGNYQIKASNTGAATTMSVWNTATHRGVYMVSAPADTYRTARPSLVFLCGNHGCSLSEIRTGSGTYTYAAPHKAGRDKEAVAVVSIPLTLNGD